MSRPCCQLYVHANPEMGKNDSLECKFWESTLTKVKNIAMYKKMLVKMSFSLYQTSTVQRKWLQNLQHLYDSCFLHWHITSVHTFVIHFTFLHTKMHYTLLQLQRFSPMSTLLMLHKTRPLTKWFITQFTNKRFFTCMNSTMFREGSIVNKSLIAHIALIGPLPRMGPFMCRKRTTLCETFITYFTHIWFLPSMDTFMFY
jgi:hypothetical protein